MDSSRGGPLTTFIMTLPLIVVPALALLRPADQEGSLLHSLLSAGTRAVSGESADSAGKDGNLDPFEDLFTEVTESASEFEPDTADDSAGLDDDLFAEASGTALADDFESSFGAPPVASAPPTTASPINTAQPPPVDLAADPQIGQLMAQLKQMGVRRTLWFSPGDQTVGFVAFFRAGQGIVSYRFSAVANSRAAAIADVIGQARRWQETQAE